MFKKNKKQTETLKEPKEKKVRTVKVGTHKKTVIALWVEWKNTKSPAFACESGRCWVASYCACAVLGKEIPAFP